MMTLPGASAIAFRRCSPEADGRISDDRFIVSGGVPAVRIFVQFTATGSRGAGWPPSQSLLRRSPQAVTRFFSSTS